MLTARGKYGLKALGYLAALDIGKSLQATEISDAHNIPKKFLDAILGDLRNAGIVFSKKGPGGGYMLARPPADINIGHAIRTLDGPLAPIRCASRTAYMACRDCRDVSACTVRITMAKVRDAISEVLDGLTLADMVASGKPVSKKAMARRDRPSSPPSKARQRVGRSKSRSTMRARLPRPDLK
jgi:Rrf2 family protein